MALFSERASMLEVQNRALIKTAGERAQRISDLERELQRALQEVERLKEERKLIQASEELKAETEQLKAEAGRMKAETEQLKAEAGRMKAEMERLKTEGQRLKVEVGQLKAEHEFYHSRVLTLERDNRELTEAATKYSVWGQKLERELARIDPAGVPARRFGAEEDA
jgi:chromosome segregation ATPase